MNAIEFAQIVGGVIAVVGSFLTVRKFKPEKDSLIVTQAQGAATILNDLVQTLERQLERKDREIARLEAALAECRGQSVGG